MSKKTILITGATGFLGSHILKKLDEENKYNIVALKRSFSDLKRIRGTKFTNVSFYDVDVSSLEDIFSKSKIDLIIHTATEYGRQGSSISKVIESNLLFPIKIIELAILNNTRCFINTDSYFNKENFTYNYLFDYSMSKKSLIRWLENLSSKIQIVNIVLEHLYGEEDNDVKFVETMIQRIAIKMEKSVDLTHGHQRRDFIYISDAVDAYLKIVDYCFANDFRYKVFNVGTGIGVEIRDFVNLIKQLSDSPTVLNFGKILYRGDEIMESKADISELKNIRFVAVFSIKNGIKRIIDYYRQRS